jgi:NADH-quinone oxidoreductase subunit D
MYTWRDRELVMDILAELTGNRVNYGINIMGGVKRDLESRHIEDILKAIDALEERTKHYLQISREESTFIQRLSGVGTLSREDALSLGAVGPTARASNIARDTRSDDPYAAYSELGFNIVTDNHNDVYARTLVRMGELMETYRLIRMAIAKMPDGPIAVNAPRKIPAGEAFSRYEAPRGEDVHYVKSNGSDKPERVKIRAPTLANIQCVAKMLEDKQLADLPIVIAAIDPCFSCTDRLISINNADDNRSGILKSEDLRLYGIKWYRNKGVDFSELNKKLAERL